MAKLTANFRPEIQALRALAVLGTILFHSWPGYVPGGHAGVDVFFVVSGFLITGMLVREYDRTGRISFKKFYWRRVRRLLPAAFATLIFCAIMILAFVPQTDAQGHSLWGYYFRQLGFSAIAGENWSELADSQSGDAWLAHLPKQPVSHFWSLGVEEQFYFVWPALIVLIAWLTRKAMNSAARTRGLVAVLSVITVGTFILCVQQTYVNVNLGYFPLYTRAWELGIGALLALAPDIRDRAPRLRAVMGWVGFAIIAGSLVGLRNNETFPGWQALLPVVGAVLVIAAGSPEVPWAISYWARWRPVQAFGDASYSIYLWHWPIIFFADYVFGVAMPAWAVVILIVVGVAVGFASKRWIEDVFREPPHTLNQEARKGANRRDTPELQHGKPSGKLVGFNIPDEGPAEK